METSERPDRDYAALEQRYRDLREKYIESLHRESETLSRERNALGHVLKLHQAQSTTFEALRDLGLRLSQEASEAISGEKAEKDFGLARRLLAVAEQLAEILDKSINESTAALENIDETPTDDSEEKGQ